MYNKKIIWTYFIIGFVLISVLIGSVMLDMIKMLFCE